MKTQIHIRKEKLKFSAAHMTVFPDGTKEALHGHNYQVELGLVLKDSSFEKMISFSVFKAALSEICESWDEKVLLASENPFLKEIKKEKKELEFMLCKKRYVLPTEEVEFLPVENISSECLAQHFLELFVKKMGSKQLKKTVTEIFVRIEESPGQGATAFWSAQSI